MNSFQRAMRDWDALRPYNAVHAARFTQPLDPDRLRTALRTALSDLRIGPVRERGGWMEFQSPPGDISLDALALAEGIGPVETIRLRMETEINTAFRSSRQGDTPFLPFRFFTVPHGRDPAAGFWLGISYYHPVADASAIVGLYRAIGGRLSDPDRPATAPPAFTGDRIAPPYSLGRWLKRFPGHLKTTRKLHAPALHADQTERNGLLFSRLETPRWNALKAASKSWGVTLNDIFLAALLLCNETIAADRFRLKSKPLMAATCVVSAREPGDESFGLNLGLFRVTHPVPPGSTLESLARDIHRQTALLKSSRDFLAVGRDLSLARALTRVFPLDGRGKFYHKYNPSWGGVTNMNLERLTDSPSECVPVDYWRSVSTGPVTPIALSLTSAASELHIGFSYRESVHPPATASFLHNRLKNLLCLQNP